MDAAPDETEKQERLEQLAYLLLPDKANDSEAGVFFTTNGRKMLSAALICYYAMDGTLYPSASIFFRTTGGRC